VTIKTVGFLKKLLDTAGPSGFEQAPGRVWRDEVGTFAEDVRVDVHGNSVASLRVARDLRTGNWWTGLSTGTSLNSSVWATWSPTATWVDVQRGIFV